MKIFRNEQRLTEVFHHFSKKEKNRTEPQF